FRVRRAGNIPVHEQFFHAANICSGTTCAIQPAVRLTSSSYTWEVQTGNSLGPGPWSSPMSFQVIFPPGQAALQAPSGAITATNPTFSWNISADHATADPATWYYLWINGPSGKVLAEWYEASQVCNNSTCSVNPGINLSGGAHRWWIQTWNQGGYGPWTPAMDFNLPLPDVPGAATLNSPSGSITDTTPTYSWDRVSASAWYYLWVSRVNADDTLTTVYTKWYESPAVCTASTCSVTPPGLTLSSGNYRWWLRTWNAGEYGPWSSGMNYTVGP
ncbi:MAG TPA: hypothetical protein VFO91_18050, partial [Anaerolineales bacterium]|nr:hypothetical protein [Anaerolineales bacterium]